MYFYEDESIKLFDLVKDISESTDLSTSQSEIAARLLKELKEWTTAVDAPIPNRPNPSFSAGGIAKAGKAKPARSAK